MNNLLGYLNDITLSPIIFLLLAALIKCLLISFYCGAIYCAVHVIKKLLRKKMSVRANYYTWYALLLSLPLSSMAWNDVIKLPLYQMYYTEWRVLLCSVAFVLLLLVIGQLVAQIITTFRIKQSILQTKPYDDGRALELKAAIAMGLRPEHIHIVIADFVQSPVSYGMFRKVILLPTNYTTRYSDDELYLLLLHEMAHIKNHDTVKLQCIGIAECVYWVLRLFRKPFRRDSEILCDNRVMSIQAGGTNAYGHLLVKECSAQTAVKGIGFSDSYHTVKSRLEALSTFRPEKHKLALFTVAVAIVLMLSFGQSYRKPAEWLTLNPAFNLEFDIYVMVAEGEGEFVEYSREPLISDDMGSIYVVTDGELRVDQLALWQALQPYREEGIDVAEVWFHSVNYVIDTNLTYLENYTERSLLGSELAQVNEENRYYTSVLPMRGLTEMIYLAAAHWL